MDVQRPPGPTFNTVGSFGSLPEYIITNFIPGARPLLVRYPSIFKLAALFSALYYLVPLSKLKTVWSEFSSFFCSTIVVHSDEDLFEYLTDHFITVKTLRTDHTLIASTDTSANNPRIRRRYDYSSDSDSPTSAFSTKPKPKVNYETSQGYALFVHAGRLFLATRRDTNQQVYGGGRNRTIEALSITCLGRNAAPIKAFLEHIYTTHKNTEKVLTIIRRPHNDGGYGDRRGWSRVTAKPRRQMETVILDQKQKQSIVDDVSEYMDPDTRQFYGSHGIPYRRGYLFYGPPGTGKTSFALAIAAQFDMDVYVMSLLERAIGDSELIALLNQLPPKSLLLLEDVDTAGLGRKQAIDTEEDNTDPLGRHGEKRQGHDNDTDDDSNDDDSDIGDRPKIAKPQSRVTLSGLLNAIDGVAAPEGHILIMTTNRPDELDEALLRAGRISVKVGFRMATQAVAEGLFLKMYLPAGVKDSLTGEQGAKEEVTDKIKTAHKEHEDVVRELAKAFASKMEDDEFSPADLQDYFLVRKKDPRKAVDDVRILKEETEKEKERKRGTAAKMRLKRERANKKKKEKQENTVRSSEDHKVVESAKEDTAIQT